MGRRKSRYSKSINSQSEQRIVRRDNNDNDKVYLPNSKGIYITKTKRGKPAFGRKKPGRLLDLGFDMLGQTFGIPSRMNIEQEARRRQKSFGSHSPGLLTSPGTTNSSTPRGRPGKRSHSRKRESSPVMVGKRSLRFPSASTPIRLRRGKPSSQDGASHSRVSSTTDSGMTPGSSNPSTPLVPTLPPPPPPPPLLPSTWNTQPLGSNMSTMAPDYSSLTTPPTGALGYSAQPPQSSLGWGSPLAHVGLSHSYVQPPGSIASRSASMPISIYQPQSAISYQEAKPPTYPMPEPFPASSFPPPPPVQLQPISSSTSWPQGDRDIAASKSPLRYSLTEAKKCEEHYNATVRAKSKTDKGAQVANAKQDLSKHIQHIHLCAACGKKRSRGYQRAHPLKKGQIPERDYCYRCVRNVAAMKSDGIDDASIASRANDDSASTVCTDVTHVRSSSKRVDANAYHGRMLKGKSRRLSLLSSLRSSTVDSEDRAQPPETLFPAREPEFGVPTPILVPGAQPGRSGRPKPYVEEADDDISFSESNVPRHRLEIASNEAKRPTPGKGARARNSSLAGNGEREKLDETLPTQKPRGSGNVHDIDIVTSPKVPAPEGRSRVSRLRFFKLPSKERPKFSTKRNPQLPEAMSPGDGARDEQRQVRDDKYHDLCNMIQDTVDDDNDGSPKKRANDTRGPGDKYTPTHENKPRGRGYDRHQAPRHAMASFEQPVRSQDIGRREHSDRRRVRRQGDSSRRSRQGGWEGYGDDTPGLEPDTPDDPNYAHKWEEPQTPTDISHADPAFVSYHMDGPWGRSDEEMDREAEVVIEQDLASAGKLFNDMTSPLYTPGKTSGTSRLPISGFMARAEISVVSYSSYEELDGGNLTTVYELAETSDKDKSTSENARPVKRLEFLGKVDQKQKGVARIRPAPNRWQGPRGGQSEPSQKRSEKNPQHAAERRSRSSSKPLSQGAETSMIVHTGHSTEGPPLDSFSYARLTMTGRRQRVPRPLQQ
ncbi:hypothetical protein F4677DRAFT_460217 [Hypoxylon crocopeplum]|nr:hypothetical protein F4677DRAFT_460217 [Hypoxylon crocopeplum]